MGLHTFKGGIHPYDGKELVEGSADLFIESGERS